MVLILLSSYLCPVSLTLIVCAIPPSWRLRPIMTNKHFFVVYKANLNSKMAKKGKSHDSKRHERSASKTKSERERRKGQPNGTGRNEREGASYAAYVSRRYRKGSKYESKCEQKIIRLSVFSSKPWRTGS